AGHRGLVPQGRHLPPEAAEPDRFLPPAGHARRVEPRLRLAGLPAIPVRGAAGGRRGVQADPHRHPAQRALLVPQRVQVLRRGQPGAAELPDARLERLPGLPHPARPERVRHRTRRARARVRRQALHRQGLAHHRRDLPQDVSPDRRVDQGPPQRRPHRRFHVRYGQEAGTPVINAVGNPQTVLLFGGTSEIGLAIVAEYLKKGPARVVLATLPGDRLTESAVEQMRAAGASEVEVLDFDALDTDSHPKVVDAAWARGDVDVAIVAFGLLGDAEQLWQDQSKAVQIAGVNYTAAVSVGVLVGEK